jgi:multidrug efflux system outer membrane protein
MRFRSASLIAGVAALSACSLQPKYVQPIPVIPTDWPAGDAYLRKSEAGLPALGYRDIFRDSKLQSLIARALANNQDIKLALANVTIARGTLRTQRAAQLPQFDARAAATFADAGTARSNNTTTARGTTESYSADIGLSAFEIDLFGRLRSLSDAALQQYLGTEAAVRTARLSLIAETASAYLTLATDRSLLAIAIDTERNAARSVALTGARLQGGIAPRTDLRQAETVQAQARSDKADLITLVAQDRNALQLLVGAPVDDADLPASIESVDGLLGELPAGLDSTVLLRRPDVVQAEYTLKAANARIGAARAAFFPTISITSAVGLASNALSALFTGNAFNWSVAPSASLPIFDGGVNRGNLQSAQGTRDAALAKYQKAIQTAFSEVADALARRGTIDAKYTAQSDLERASRDSFTLTQARYREGIDSFLTSLDAQRTYYSARRTLTAARLTRADNLVQLYRTIGSDPTLE